MQDINLLLPYEIIIKCLIRMDYNLLWNGAKLSLKKESIFSEALRVKLILEKPSIKFRYRLVNLCPRGNSSSSYINMPFSEWDRGLYQLKFDTKRCDSLKEYDYHYSSLVKKERSSFKLTAQNLKSTELIFNPSLEKQLKYQLNKQFSINLDVQSIGIQEDEEIRLKIKDINISPNLLFSNPDQYDVERNCFYI